MTSASWPLVEIVARLLEGEEREAVLGDLEEGKESAWRGLFGVLGLICRRQVELWKSWRPWLAGFGVALPSSLLLMGASLTVSWSYQRLLCPELLHAASLTRGSGFLLLLCQAIVLTGWSWTGGFVVGTVSRRTLWASTLLCYSPCLFCLARFRVDSLPRFCLLLFLLPAVWGVRRGLRISRIGLGWAMAVAIAVTVLMIPAWSTGGAHLWSLNWALSLPAWYLVVKAKRAGREPLRA
jgi:hypothetical protein